MDVNEARQRLAESPPQGDPTEIAVGETLAERAARLRAHLQEVAGSVEEFIEWGYLIEYPEGTRGAVSLLASARWPSKRAEYERERALGMFRTLERDPQEMRLVFVSRRVTYTPWTDEEEG